MEIILNQLLELTNEKKTIMEEILVVSKKQLESVVEKNAEKFEQYTNVRQNMMNDVDVIDKKANALREEMNRILNGKTMPSNNIIEETLKKSEEIQNCLKEIVKVNDECYYLSVSFMEECRKDMQNIGTNKKVRNAYTNNNANMSLGVINTKN